MSVASRDSAVERTPLRRTEKIRERPGPQKKSHYLHEAKNIRERPGPRNSHYQHEAERIRERPGPQHSHYPQEAERIREERFAFLLKNLLGVAIRAFFNIKEQKLLRLEGLSVSLSSPLLRFS